MFKVREGKEMKNKIINISKIRGLDYVIIFIIILFSNVCMRQSVVPMEIYSDHFGLLAIPAKLSGYDWNYLISIADYYGPGFFVLYTPILKYIHDPVLIYNLLVDINFIILAISGVALQYLITRELDYKYIWRSAVSVIISNTVILQTLIVGAIGNESVIVLFTVIFSIIIVKIIKTNSYTQKTTLLVAGYFLCLYSLTVHLRNIVFVVAAGGLVIYLCLIGKIKNNKKNRILIGIGILSAFSLVFAYKNIPSFFMNILYDEIPNGIRKYNTNISFEGVGFSREFIKGFFIILIGNLVASIKQTHGIILISYYLILKELKILFVYWIKKENEFFNKKNISYRVVFLFSALCYTIGLIALSVSWWWNPRGTGYWRYYGSYGLLLIFLSLLYAFEKIDLRYRHKILAIMGQTILIKIFCIDVIPILGEYLDFWFVYKYIQNNEPIICFFYTILIASIGGGILLSRNKFKEYIYILYFVLFAFIPYFQGGNFLSYQANERCNKTYQLINELHEEGIINAKEELYFIGRDSTLMYYQFMVLEYGFKTELPRENENIVVFSEYNSEEIGAKEKGWFQISLDDNEYVYSTNEEIINIVEDIVNKIILN